MPELERLRPDLAAAGVDLVGISLDTAPPATVGHFLARAGITYPNYLGGRAAIERIYATDEIFVPVSFVLRYE